MNPLPSPWNMLSGTGYHELAHSPNLGAAMPRPFITSAAAAARLNQPRVVNWVEVTQDQRARDQAAREIADRRRAAWATEHPGEPWGEDAAEYLALGRELSEAGLGTGLTSQWLAMCCAHYRTQQAGGRWRYLDTHQTEMQPPAPGMDRRLVCVRCGATFPQLNREPCRGDEIYRERVRTDRIKLGSLVELFSELGG